MTLAERIQMAKNGNGKIESISNKVEKIIEKKKEASFDSGLTLEKFARIDSMEKTINSHGLILEKVLNQISLVSSDQKAIVSLVDNMSKAYQETNGIIETIAKNSQAIRSQIDSIACRISSSHIKPETTKTETVITRKKEEKEETKNQETESSNISENEKLFNLFMANFNNKFAGSKNYSGTTKEVFDKLINSLDFANVSNSLSEIWKSYKAKNVFIFAMNKKQEALDAMEKAVNTFSAMPTLKKETIETLEAITPKTRTLPKLGKEKAKSENDLESFKKSLGYFKTNLVDNNETDFIEVIKLLKLEEVNQENKGQTVSMVFDWLKEAYEVKRNTIADFIQFYIDNKTAIIKAYALK